MQSIVITNMKDRPLWTSFEDFQKHLGIRYHEHIGVRHRVDNRDIIGSNTIYDIIDHRLFFLSVIKYGITFVDGDKYEWLDPSGNLRNRHGVIKSF